ncbi:MAG: TonB-dependent receptor [Planctomycetes bacterium]|nr:TonB-dependent receptor [Planctomycetota bacterium]
MTEPAGQLDDLSSLSLEDLLGLQVETVSGASRHVQEQREAPSAVTVLTAEDVRRHGWRTLSDALRSVRGVDVTDDRSYEHLGLRGFNPLGDYNSRVLLLIDGHRMNDPVYDTATIGLDLPLDLDLVERIELVRGPGSALYGSNAFFGVINIVTRKASDIAGAELAAGVGSRGLRLGRGTWGGEIDDGTSLVASVSGTGSDGDRYDYPEYSGDPTGGHVSGTDGERARSLWVALTRGDVTFTAASGRRAKDFPTGSYESVIGDDRNVTRDAHTWLDAAWHPESDGPWDVTARAFYDDYSYFGTYVYDDGGTYVNHDRGEGRTLGGELLVSNSSIEGHRLTLGGEVRDDYRQDQSNYDSDVYLDVHDASTTWGVFAQDEIALADTLGLTAGMRYDRDTDFGGTLNPRLALVWTPREQSTVKLLAGDAYRAPNAFEASYHDGFVTTKPNPDLDPETIRTYELVWEEDLAEGVRSSISLWRYALTDLITQVVDPADGLLVFENVDRVDAHGVEFEVEGRFESGWRTRLSQVWQQAEDGEGQPLTNSPDHLTKASLLAPLVDESLWLGLELQHTGERRTLAGDRSRAALVTNLTLRLLTDDDWDLSATVTNLFDVAVEAPGGSDLAQDVLALPGRALVVQGRKRF